MFRFVSWWELRADNNFTQETAMTMITPSAQLTLTKREQKLELHRGGGRSRTSGSPWLLDLGCHSLRPLFFCLFFFFFFFFCVFGPFLIKIKPSTRRPGQ
eukprot:FR736116.1.p2 GENE.FR736116.1~~FR736116.1.p2  ORF type:complete len:100 (-),score=29.76 FR736116.1:469-768(-)